MKIAHRCARGKEVAGNETGGNERNKTAGNESSRMAGSESSKSAGSERAGAGRPIGRKLVGELLRASARIAVSRNALLIGFEVTGPRLRLMKTIRRKREPRTVSQLARA